MGTLTITGALIIIVGWLTLIEFDHLPEAERRRLIWKVKTSPPYIIIIALMPLGIIINLIASYVQSLFGVILGASFIFIQSFIISFIFWRYRRWKGIFLFIITIVLLITLCIPLLL